MRTGIAMLFAGRWWEARWAVIAAILLSAVPLLLPSFPPLVDVPGHIGRYHVAYGLTHSADLRRGWTYHWSLIGNLGVDLLVMPLQPLFGPVLAAKLVILTIPPLFVAGLIALSRACDRRQSPLLALAFPLAYGFPFQFGFVNFMLSAALALLALALWIRWGREGRIGLRALVFVPISCGLWVAHSFGWGMFGLLAFASDWQRRHREGAGLIAAPLGAGLNCLVLTLPLVPMALAMGHGGGGAGLGITYSRVAKLFWILTMFRERWQTYDFVCTALLIAMPLAALVARRTFRFDASLAVLAMVGIGIFGALPRLLLGGAYVDARMFGIAMALALAAIRCRDARSARAIAGLAAAFFLIRTATTTFALLGFAHVQAEALAVLPDIPRGAAVLVVVNEPCGATWYSDRLEHVDGIAITRRDIFDNGQWTLSGQQLIDARHPAAGIYRADPSQLAYPKPCEPDTTSLPSAIRDFDRGTFGYVWTMDFPSKRTLAPDVHRVWANAVSQLYRVGP